MTSTTRARLVCSTLAITCMVSCAALVAAPAGAATNACVSYTQYPKHPLTASDYTNVYLDNNCSYSTSVKVRVANGYDSGCITLAPRQMDRLWVAHNYQDPIAPSVRQLDSCLTPS